MKSDSEDNRFAVTSDPTDDEVEEFQRRFEADNRSGPMASTIAQKNGSA